MRTSCSRSSPELDLSEFYAVHEAKDTRGRAGYPPAMLVAVLIYAYCTGRRSSRSIERATYEDVAFRVLSGDQHPDAASAADRMRYKVASVEEQALYKMRKAIVEPVFGQMKERRGLRRVLLRGFAAASAEFQIMALGHNLLKLFRYGPRLIPKPA